MLPPLALNSHLSAFAHPAHQRDGRDARENAADDAHGALPSVLGLQRQGGRLQRAPPAAPQPLKTSPALPGLLERGHEAHWHHFEAQAAVSDILGRAAWAGAALRPCKAVGISAPGERCPPSQRRNGRPRLLSGEARFGVIRSGTVGLPLASKPRRGTVGGCICLFAVRSRLRRAPGRKMLRHQPRCSLSGCSLGNKLGRQRRGI